MRTQPTSKNGRCDSRRLSSLIKDLKSESQTPTRGRGLLWRPWIRGHGSSIRMWTPRCYVSWGSSMMRPVVIFSSHPTPRVGRNRCHTPVDWRHGGGTCSSVPPDPWRREGQAGRPMTGGGPKYAPPILYSWAKRDAHQSPLRGPVNFWNSPTGSKSVRVNLATRQVSPPNSFTLCVDTSHPREQGGTVG